MAMPELQRFPWNLKNVEDIVVFMTQKVFISVNFSIISNKQKMPKSFLQKTHKWKKKKNMNIWFNLDQTKGMYKWNSTEKI